MNREFIMPSKSAGDSRRRVLMLGTSPTTKGGVASVVRAYMSEGLFAKWPITYLATHSDGSRRRKTMMAMAAWIRFATLLLRRRNFLVHVHGASRASFWRKSAFILPAAWLGHSVIFHLHGGEFMQFYGQECGKRAQWFVRHVLRKCSRIIVLSTSWRDSLAELTGNKVEIVANFAPEFHRSGERIPGKILFLGRLCKGKGIFVLLEAVAQLAARHPEVRLVCGGDGDPEPIRAAATRLGVADRVEFLGWIDKKRKEELLAQASVYALPSFAEGMPMSILEAMSAGLPVVATPLGGIPDAITDGREGFLVPKGDVSALRDALGRLLADSALRKAMGARGREKFFAAFSSAVVLPKIGNIYEELGVSPVRALGTPGLEPAVAGAQQHQAELPESLHAAGR